MTRKRIAYCLLAEDDPIDVEMIQRAFADTDPMPEVVVARDGIEALVTLEESPHRPWLLLLDIKMPRLGGLDLLEKLRQDSRFARTPAFILTTSFNASDLRRAHELGVAGYIVKPDSLERLESIVRMLSAYCSMVEPPSP